MGRVIGLSVCVVKNRGTLVIMGNGIWRICGCDCLREGGGEYHNKASVNVTDAGSPGSGLT